RIFGGLTIGDQLDVVGGGSGPLRDAGNRGAVHAVAVERGRLHDPLREHAAALPADGGNQQRDEPGLAHARARALITARRSRSTSRVHGPGFVITCTWQKDGHSTAACATSPHTPQPTRVSSTCAIGSA